MSRDEQAVAQFAVRALIAVADACVAVANKIAPLHHGLEPFAVLRPCDPEPVEEDGFVNDGFGI